MLFAPRFRRAPSEKAVICLFSCLYQVFSHILGVSLPPSACSNPLCRHPPLPPRRSPLVLRLFALALADGSGLPFSLYPPPAALESQTPQREPRALPRRATFPKGKAKRLPPQTAELASESIGKPKYSLRKTSVSPVRLCAPHKSFPCAHFSFLIALKAKIAIYRYRNRKKI